MKKSVVIRMEGEIEARPIANLVQTATGYASQTYLEVGERRVNIKSIMGMMGLAIMDGDTVVLDVQGEDEDEALAALEKFLTK